MTLRFSSNSINNEDQLMPLIIKNLQDSGGELTRQELEKLIANESDEWHEYVEHENISERSHKPWRPFLYTFNYTLKHLKLAGYLDYKRFTPIRLTVQGIRTDLAKFSPDAVRAASQPIWDAEVKQRKQNKTEQHPTDTDGLERDELPVDEQETCASDWREDLKARLKNMDPYLFEAFCRGLLRKMGIIIDEDKGTKKSNDGGIDGYGYAVNSSYRTERVALQCKRFNEGQVGSKNIDELKGAIDSYSAEYGIFMTTSSYSKAAREKAQLGRTPITLIDGDDLINLIEKYEYKVRKVTYYVPDDSKIWGEDDE